MNSISDMKKTSSEVGTFGPNYEALNSSSKSFGEEGSGRFASDANNDGSVSNNPIDFIHIGRLLINTAKFAALMYFIIILCYHFTFGGSFSVTQTAINYLIDILFFVDYMVYLFSLQKIKIEPIDADKLSNKVDFTRSESFKLSNNRSTTLFYVIFIGTELLVQILMVFPFELFNVVQSSDTWRLLRLFRLVRSVYFFTFWDAVFQSLEENEIFISSIFQRTLFLALLVAVMSHIAACTFYCLAYTQMEDGYKHTWLYYDNLARLNEATIDGVTHYSVQMLQSINHTYLRALYWSVQTIDTVGFGDIVPHTPAETWYCIFFFYLSALLIYLSIANLVMFATNFDSSRTENLRKISHFDKFASYRKLPVALSKKVRAFYAYQWQQFKGVEEFQILSELPPNIAQQIIQSLVRDKLIQVDVFKCLSKGLLNSLSEFVDTFTYSPGDIIVQSDTVVVGLYVISTGDVELLNIFGNVVEIFQSPHCFGDKSLLTPKPAPNDSSLPEGNTKSASAAYISASEYRARTFVEIFYIDGDVFQSICNPELIKVNSNVANRVMNAINASASRLSPPALIEGIDSSVTKANDEVRTTEQPTASSAQGASSDRPSIFDRVKDRFGSVVMNQNKHKTVHKTWRGHFVPQSGFRMLWDFVLFLIIIFYLLSVSLLLSGTVRQLYVKDNYSLIVVSYVADFIMCVDLGFQITVFSFLQNGILYSDFSDIWRHFVLDNNLILVILAYFPFDLILGVTVDHRLLPVFRLLKIIHVSRLSHFLRNFEEVLIVFFDINLSFEMSRFLGLYFLLFLLCHWMGCLWQLTSDYSFAILGYQNSWRHNDMHNEYLFVDYKSMSHTVSYFRSIYLASNVMSSIGFGDSLPVNPFEVAAMIFLIFFGYLLFNALLGAIASLMSNFNRDKKEFDEKVDKIKALMKLKSIPEELQTRIIRYHEYVWARYGGVKELEVLNSLPKALRAEVSKHVMGPLIKKISFFSRSSASIQQIVVDLLKPRIFLDDDAIAICGELGKEMFIIEKGTAIVTALDKNILYNTLSDGDYIGESSLLAVTRRTASAYAVGYVGTYYLTSDDFYNAFEKFPSEYNKILNYITVTQKIKQQMNTKSESVNGHLSASPSMNDLFFGHEKSISHIEMVELNNRDRTRRRTNSEDLVHRSEAAAAKKVLHPESTIKLGWDVMIFCTLVYYSIVIPLRVALNLSPWIYVVDFICDIINIVDDYLYSSVFASFVDGRLLTSVPLMRAQYRHSLRFYIDLATIFPYDLIVLYTVAVNYTLYDRLWVLAVLRLPKMLKLLLVKNYYTQVERLLCQVVGIKHAYLRLAELTFSVLFIAHWVACIWYLFGQYVHPVDGCADAALAGESLVGCKYVGTWVEQQIWTMKLPADGGDQWSRFLRALNWALPNLTSETLGDINGINAQESLFTFFTLFVGLSINGVIIGGVTSLVTNANEDTSDMYTKIDVLKDFLAKRGVPSLLINRASTFLNHGASQEGLLTSNQDKIFSKLPHTLLYSINYQLKTLKYLRRCPFFDFCSDEVLRGISSKLRVKMFSKGDNIITSGELGNEMFFIDVGEVNVLSSDNQTVFSSLEDGAFFGETGLFFKTPRVATIVVSSAYCVCLVLTKVDLNVELRSCDYNSEEVLKSFKLLQESNQNRNISLTENLRNAKDPHSKLHKMIVLDDRNDNHKSKSPLQRLRLLLSPDSTYRIVWDFLGLLFLVYYSVSIPLYIAFFLPNTVGWYLESFIWIDFLIDLYFILDMIGKCYLFSFKIDLVHNKLCAAGDAIQQKYLNDGYFYFDVAGSIPFEFLALIPGMNPMVLFMCRSTHLMRAPQLIKYAALVEGHMATLGYAFSQSVSLLVKAGCGYVLLTHWLACVYFAIHRYSERNCDHTYVVMDKMATFDPVTGQHDICSVTVSFCYARSFYFVLNTMTSIGYGDISPYTNSEIAWQQVVAVVGAFIAAMFVGFSEMYWRSTDAAGDSKIKTKLREIEYYATLRKLDPSLKDYILAQYKHSWKQLKSVNGDSGHLFDQLSDACRLEIFLHLHSNILSKVNLLDDLPYQAKRRFAAALRPQIGLRSTYLYRAGDIGLAFFFVHSGKVAVTLSTDTSTLDAFGLHAMKLQLNKQQRQGLDYDTGCHFGECCLLSNAGIRNDNAQVSEDGELYSMPKNEFWTACQYMSFSDRRSLMLRLFGTVGIVKHVKIAASAVSYSMLSEDEGDDTHHIKFMYSMAYGVVSELSKLIVDNMAEEESEDDEDESDSDGENLDDSMDNDNNDNDENNNNNNSNNESNEVSRIASPVNTIVNGSTVDGQPHQQGSPNTKKSRPSVRKESTSSRAGGEKHHHNHKDKVRHGTFLTARSSSRVQPEYDLLNSHQPEVKATPIRTRLSTLFLGKRMTAIRPIGLTASISRRDNIRIGKASVLQVKMLLHNKTLVDDVKLKTEIHLQQEAKLLSKHRNMSMLSSFAESNISCGLLVDSDSGKFKEASAKLKYLIEQRRRSFGGVEEHDGGKGAVSVPLTIIEETGFEDDGEEADAELSKFNSRNKTEDSSPYIPTANDSKERQLLNDKLECMEGNEEYTEKRLNSVQSVGDDLLLSSEDKNNLFSPVVKREGFNAVKYKEHEDKNDVTPMKLALAAQRQQKM